MAETVAAIICAAGASERFGGKRKKQFAEVARRAAFLRSIEFFDSRDDVKQIILCIAKEDEELIKITYEANLSFYGVKICYGGAERFETVANGLKLVREDIDLIAVHDAARCCLKNEWLDAVIAKAGETGAAILACPVTDTVKKAPGDVIVETIDRTNLYRAQTPQVFKSDLLRKAYKTVANFEKGALSDDSQLVEAIGEKVAIVETDESNIKITTKSDIAMAEAIIKSRPKPKPDGPIGPYVDVQW